MHITLKRWVDSFMSCLYEVHNVNGPQPPGEAHHIFTREYIYRLITLLILPIIVKITWWPFTLIFFILAWRTAPPPPLPKCTMLNILGSNFNWAQSMKYWEVLCKLKGSGRSISADTLHSHPLKRWCWTYTASDQHPVGPSGPETRLIQQVSSFLSVICLLVSWNLTNLLTSALQASNYTTAVKSWL